MIPCSEVVRIPSGMKENTRSKRLALPAEWSDSLGSFPSLCSADQASHPIRWHEARDPHHFGAGVSCLGTTAGPHSPSAHFPSAGCRDAPDSNAKSRHFTLFIPQASPQQPRRSKEVDAGWHPPLLVHRSGRTENIPLDIQKAPRLFIVCQPVSSSLEWSFVQLRLRD